MSVVLILLAVLAAGILCGWLLARFTPKPVLYSLWILIVGFIAYLWYAAQDAQGWDGIGYAIGIFVFMGPFLVGSMLAAFVTWWRMLKQDSQDAATGPDEDR